METHFQSEVSRSLGALEAGVEGINARLDKLNGSVARHEQRLNALETRDAVEDAKDAAVKETNKTWRDNLFPIVKTVLPYLLGAAGIKLAPAVLKALGQ